MMDASIQEYMRAESITVASVGLVYDQELGPLQPVVVRPLVRLP